MRSRVDKISSTLRNIIKIIFFNKTQIQINKQLQDLKKRLFIPVS